MAIEVVFAIAGVICLIYAIIGKNIKFGVKDLNVEVQEALKVWQRTVFFIIGIVFVGVALWPTFKSQPPVPQPEEKQTEQSQPKEENPVIAQEPTAKTVPTESSEPITTELPKEDVTKVIATPTAVAMSTPVPTSIIPYGTPIKIKLPDGSIVTIEVKQLIGKIDRIAQLAHSDPLPVIIPPNWNWSQLPQNLSTQWDAYQLPFSGSEPCSDWDAAFNSSSVRGDLPNIALAFAERGDAYPLLVPIGTGEIPALDDIIRDDRPIGSGPLNDSIQIILVPHGTRGFVTVWEDAYFVGRNCTLEITGE